MLSRTDRIREKVGARHLDVGVPLPEHTVAVFEQRHGIRLPDSYREFLLSIGNGGSGPPEYGLMKLGETPKDLPRDEAKVWSELPRVRQPFPFTQAWVWEDGELSLEGLSNQVNCGSLCLGTDGCGMYWHLVVSGPERGNVWMLSGEGIQPTNPKRDFLEWYEAWLDGVEDWWSIPQ